MCVSWQEREEDGAIMIATRSASDELFAPQKGYIRGFLQISAYLIQPYRGSDNPVPLPLPCAANGLLGPGECKVTLLVHTELGGTLPASVINMLSTSAPAKILSAVNEIVSKKYK